MGKKKLTQYSLLSGLVLTTLAAGHSVLADDVVDTNATPATGADQTSEVAQSGPQVKTISQTTEGTKTTTVSEVTSPELTQAVNDVNSFNAANSQATPSTGNESDTAAGTPRDANATVSNVVVPPITISEGETKTYDTVEEADAANKAQAEAIQNSLEQYKKDVADYKEKLANYTKEQEKYVADKAAYDEKVQAYNDYQEKVNDLVNPETAKTAEGLVFTNEPNAVMTVDGVDQYLTKESQENHIQDEILQQFNTDKYTDEDFTSENPYASNEDAWFKMNVGDTVTATYTNLENANYLGTKVAKAVATYTLTGTTNEDGTALVKLYHDPTKTIFFGAQTSTDTDKKLSADIKMTFYDENGKEIKIADNSAVMSLASLNHWTTEYGDHVEKVSAIGDNKFIAFKDSSIKLNEDGSIYSPTENEYVANGAKYNSDGADGWDAINPDGTARTPKSTYGAGAMTYSGNPFAISAEGNHIDVPTAMWFAVNTLAVEKPGQEPKKPELPKLDPLSVTASKVRVKVVNDVPNEPEQPTPPTPEKPNEPTPPTPEVPEKPVTPPTTPEKPSEPVKPTSGTPATPVEETAQKAAPTQEAQALPSTGDNGYGVAVFGAGIVAFSTLTLLGSMKRKED